MADQRKANEEDQKAAQGEEAKPADQPSGPVNPVELDPDVDKQPPVPGAGQFQPQQSEDKG